jgi:hypothetical protein
MSPVHPIVRVRLQGRSLCAGASPACAMLMMKGHTMLMPPAIAQEDKIEAEVRAVEAALKPDVIHVRHEIAEDWSGRPAIYFRVVLSDDAAANRLRKVAIELERRLAERLDFAALGVFTYHHFRSESEQAELREESWA